MTRLDPAMRGFLIHLGLFIVANIGLAALNLMRTPSHIWFIWVLAGWGIGLAAHDVALLLQRTPRREAIFIDPRVRAFFIHAFVYLAVNVLLIVVNLLVTPDRYWFYWPLIGWGVALVAHGYAVYRRRNQTRAGRSSGQTRTGARQ